jgi:hypothetical protein
MIKRRGFLIGLGIAKVAALGILELPTPTEGMTDTKNPSRSGVE